MEKASENKIKIITDSCSDLYKTLREKYDIDYVKMNTVIDGKEIPASLDWEYYSPKELYDIMRSGKRITTQQVPTAEFETVFKKYLDEGFNIVYVGCSLRLSSSVNTGAIIAKGILADYPDKEIYCVDSKCSGLGEGALAIRAAEYAKAGLSAKEIAEKISAECNTMNQFATVENLNTLKRAGRVTGAAAFFGNLMGVKPIIISDVFGNNLAIKKVKGRKTSLLECVNMMKETITSPETQTVYIGQADCMEEAEFVKQEILKAVSPKDIYIENLGPIIGSTTGPGTLSIYCFGKEVTEGEAQPQ